MARLNSNCAEFDGEHVIDFTIGQLLHDMKTKLLSTALEWVAPLAKVCLVHRVASPRLKEDAHIIPSFQSTKNEILFCT